MCLSLKTINEFHSISLVFLISHQGSFRVSSFSCSDLHSVFVVVMSHCWLWYWQRHYKNQTTFSSAQIRRDDILPCMFIRSLSDVNVGRVLKQWKIQTHKFTAFMFSLVYNAMKSELVQTEYWDYVNAIMLIIRVTWKQYCSITIATEVFCECLSCSPGKWQKGQIIFLTLQSTEITRQVRISQIHSGILHCLNLILGYSI